MFAGLRLADPQLRVLAAAPMDRQNDFARRVVDIGNNVGDEGAQELLARAHGTPGAFHAASRSSAKPLKFGGTMGGSGVRTASSRAWHVSTSAKRRLPTLLKLRGDQAIVGIAGGVAPFGERRFVSRLL